MNNMDSSRFQTLLEEYDGNPDTSGENIRSDFAPLYDVFYEQHYDYEKQAEIIESYSDLTEGDTIVEGGCAT